MSVSVGADIEAICGKCGDVWHVVVAMVGVQIAKVECKQCGKQHRYRPPGGFPKAHKAPKESVAKTPRATGKRSPRKSEPQVKVDLTKPVRRYVMTEVYQVGDRIDHKTFGEGVVESIPGRGKILVFFPTGRRVLVHEREGSAAL